MKRCVRCSLLKPDAVFRIGVYGDGSSSELRHNDDFCLSCRTIFLEMGMKTSPPSPAPRAPSPSPETLEASRVFHQEISAWRSRGRPSVPRPYTHASSGLSAGAGVQLQRKTRVRPAFADADF